MINDYVVHLNSLPDYHRSDRLLDRLGILPPPPNRAARRQQARSKGNGR